MRILRSPITKTGQVRYLELFKWLFMVMTVVMSFSYVINALEKELMAMMNIFYLVSLVVVFGEFLYTVFLGVIELKRQVESYLIPWLKQQVLQGESSLLLIFNTSTYIHQQTSIKTFDSTQICVMRC